LHIGALTSEQLLEEKRIELEYLRERLVEYDGAVDQKSYAVDSVSVTWSESNSTSSLDPSQIPEGMVACWYDKCYYDLGDKTPVGKITYLNGPLEKEFMEEHLHGFAGELLGDIISSIGDFARVPLVSAAGIAYSNLKTTMVYQYKTRIPVQIYERNIRYVYPSEAGNVFKDKLHEFPIKGEQEKYGEPVNKYELENYDPENPFD